MIFRAIKKQAIPRPGDLSGGFDKCLVPSPKEEKFWESIYAELKNQLQFPILGGEATVDPSFGYFGYRFHPVNFRPRYFHIGIDIMAEKNAPVRPVAKGVFEYSGFSNLNGNYLLISHPDIKTEDGFVLYSMYIHLEHFTMRFNLLEKIIRELGGRRITNKVIKSSDNIGEVGATGNIRGLVPHLHLQLEFRKSDGTVIAINPAQALGIASHENSTAQIKSLEEFKRFYQSNKINLSRWARLWDFTEGGEM